MKRNLRARKGRHTDVAVRQQQKSAAGWASKLLTGQEDAGGEGLADESAAAGGGSIKASLHDDLYEMQAAVLRRQHPVLAECTEGEILSSLHTYGGDVDQAARICLRIARQRRADELTFSDSAESGGEDDCEGGEGGEGGDAAAATAASGQAEMAPGQKVWLVGLAGRKVRLNGQAAVVIVYQPGAGRYVVQLLGDGEQSAILPQNLSDQQPEIVGSVVGVGGVGGVGIGGNEPWQALHGRVVGASRRPVDGGFGPATALAATLFGGWDQSGVATNPQMCDPSARPLQCAFLGQLVCRVALSHPSACHCAVGWWR